MTAKPAIRTRHDRRAAKADAAPADAPPAAPPTAGDEAYRPTRHAQIRPDPANPRTIFEEDGLDELAASIVRDGLLEPLVLRPAAGEADAFMLIAGERRWRAIGRAIEAGDWPADRSIPAMLRQVGEEDARRLALVENLQRRDLKPIEQARSLAALQELTGKSAAEIGRDLGFTERWAQQRLALLKLPDALQRQVEAGSLKLEEAREAGALLSRLPPIKAVALREGKISVADARAWAASWPQPLALEPDDLLALLELAWAITGQSKTANRWTDTPVDYVYRPSPEFDGQKLWSVNRGHSDGRDRAVVGFAGWDHLRAITGAAEPLRPELIEPLLRKARVAVLGGSPLSPDHKPDAFKDVDALFKAKRHVTAWLNAPFRVHPDWSREKADRDREIAADAERRRAAYAAEDEQRQRERTEREATKLAAAEAGHAFLTEVLALDGDAGGLAALLGRHGFEGPFTVAVEGEGPAIVGANGNALTGQGDGFEALRRVLALALNAALGFPANSGPPIEDAPWRRGWLPAEPEADDDDERGQPALDRPEFERLIANCLVEDMEVSEAEAARLATAGVEALLREEGVAYGARGLDWDWDAALALAERIRTEGFGQQVDLEDAIEATAALALTAPNLEAVSP